MGKILHPPQCMHIMRIKFVTCEIQLLFFGGYIFDFLQATVYIFNWYIFPHSYVKLINCYQVNIMDMIVFLFPISGSHCLDLLKSDESDPEWLVAMRIQEVAIIKGWIVQYYDDLVQAST